MQKRTKVILVLLAAVGAFAGGRYSVPAPDITVEKTITKDQERQVDTNKKKTTTIVTEPSGKKTETIVEETNKTAKTDTRTSATESVSETYKSPTINISVLAGVDTMNNFKPVYGISASKQFIGPITLGAFGLTNGTLGVSVGINF